MMKKICSFILLAFLCVNLFAQNDKQASEILDKTSSTIIKSGGIELYFSGSYNGKLLLHGTKFYINSGNTQSWFDGKTQWSYVNNSNEVNVSNPTSEELQSSNPYYLLTSYKHGYSYKYNGEKTISGKKLYEILLTPIRKSAISKIYVYIDKSYQPKSIKVCSTRNKEEHFNVTSYKTGLKLSDSIFKFNHSKYPKAEIIDLR